jgi:succinate dehydrogenase flavin-adding protein (antitoxin of CptAB toxin-antitoxin module)
MSKIIIDQKEIKEIFDDFIEENEIEAGKKKSFNDFLKFLEVDLYDWIKENLRCYFRG